MPIVDITTAEDFERFVLNSDKTVVVDFSAEWCAPCRDMRVSLERLASEEGELMIFTLDVDKLPELVEKYDIVGFPTIVIFRQGVEKCRRLGLINRRIIKDMTK